MDDIAAIVHTEGVILERYYALELAYTDMEGHTENFLIRYPRQVKSYNPKTFAASLDVVPCTGDSFRGHRVHSYSKVLRFLREKAFRLHAKYRRRLFGFKGRSFQDKVLRDAEIPGVNLESFGCPSLYRLQSIWPLRRPCPFHPAGRPCAMNKLLTIRCWYQSS